MEVSHVFDDLLIRSHKGTYSVSFFNDFSFLKEILCVNDFYIIDSNVASLYSIDLSSVISSDRCIYIDSDEYSKSLDQIIPIINSLVGLNIKRQSRLIAIGGGVVQDITCFISSILFRGIDWIFVPTTLLAQADSCIGSKSSINLMPFKNIIGNFYPPKQIFISSTFLRSLSTRDIASGIGEIIKVHIIDSFNTFTTLASEFNHISSDFFLLQKYIYRSLLIKKSYIEEDEFDKGIRNIFNYGHSFGHAIESATNFTIPHGVSVCIGMDLANYVSLNLGFIDTSRYDDYHAILNQNYSIFSKVDIPIDSFFDSLSKDKKNTKNKFCLILPTDHHSIDKYYIEPSDEFNNMCSDFFNSLPS